jgi:FdhE protein
MVPNLTTEGLASGRSALAGAVIRVDGGAVRSLLDKLAAGAASLGPGRVPALEALPDPMTLLQASINQDGERLRDLAAGAGAEPGPISTLGLLLSLPLLQACGRRAEPLLREASWSRGYCPVCAAWPAIGEVRGVERQRWLRCGRCASGWRHHHRVCVFCGNNDHRSQGYLSTDEGREARQSATCELCRGYLKNVASPLPLDPIEILLKDLSTLELDAAALDRGYGRPEEPGFDLGVRIEARDGR